MLPNENSTKLPWYWRSGSTISLERQIKTRNKNHNLQTTLVWFLSLAFEWSKLNRKCNSSNLAFSGSPGVWQGASMKRLHETPRLLHGMNARQAANLKFKNRPNNSCKLIVVSALWLWLSTCECSRLALDPWISLGPSVPQESSARKTTFEQFKQFKNQTIFFKVTTCFYKNNSARIIETTQFPSRA